MSDMAKASKSTATSELATERLNLKLTPAQARLIEAVADARKTSVKQAIVDAIAAFAVRDEVAEFAELGRQIADLVAEHPAAIARRRGK
jgi:acyl-CoA reductase-like NAD-dependent aldehyde dehydrogenase